jgi:membrane protease YdiL (CAAX protease family)
VSDWKRELLWNAGAYVAVAVLAKSITIGMGTHAPSARPAMRPTFWSRFGLTWRHWPANVALGVTVFIWLTPVVLCLHWVCSIVLWDRPHALAALRTANLTGWEWSFVAFQVCLAVPLIEEILFRGLLQTWLRQASLLGHLAVVLATSIRAAYGVAYYDSTAGVDVIDAGPGVFAVLLTGGYLYSLYRLKRIFDLSKDEIRAWKPIPFDLSPEDDFFETLADVRRQDEQRQQAWREMMSQLSVYGSTMLFAILHVDAWPAPIALFVMGLGLGALARRTQSLIGPIVFHAAFNLVAFIALFGTTHWTQGANGKEQTTAPRPAVAASTVSSVPASQLPLRR